MKEKHNKRRPPEFNYLGKLGRRHWSNKILPLASTSVPAGITVASIANDVSINSPAGASAGISALISAGYYAFEKYRGSEKNWRLTVSHDTVSFFRRKLPTLTVEEDPTYDLVDIKDVQAKSTILQRLMNTGTLVVDHEARGSIIAEHARNPKRIKEIILAKRQEALQVRARLGDDTKGSGTNVVFTAQDLREYVEQGVITKDEHDLYVRRIIVGEDTSSTGNMDPQSEESRTTPWDVMSGRDEEGIPTETITEILDGPITYPKGRRWRLRYTRNPEKGKDRPESTGSEPTYSRVDESDTADLPHGDRPRIRPYDPASDDPNAWKQQ